MLSDAQIERYGRQILLPGVGGRGQERLLQASVVVVGCGVAADFAATMLARAGVGRLDLVGAIAQGAAPECTITSHRPGSALPAATIRAYIDAAPEEISAQPVIVARTEPGFVASLTHAPCARCFIAPTTMTGSPAGAPWSIGSVTAALVLRGLLFPARTGALYRLTASADLRLAPLTARNDCPTCSA